MWPPNIGMFYMAWVCFKLFRKTAIQQAACEHKGIDLVNVFSFSHYSVPLPGSKVCEKKSRCTRSGSARPGLHNTKNIVKLMSTGEGWRLNWRSILGAPLPNTGTLFTETFKYFLRKKCNRDKNFIVWAFTIFPHYVQFLSEKESFSCGSSGVFLCCRESIGNIQRFFFFLKSKEHRDSKLEEQHRGGR